MVPRMRYYFSTNRALNRVCWSAAIAFTAVAVYPDIDPHIQPATAACNKYTAEHVPTKIVMGMTMIGLPMSAYAYAFTGNEEWRRMGNNMVQVVREQGDRRVACHASYTIF